MPLLSSPTPMIDEGNSIHYDGLPLEQIPHNVGTVYELIRFERMVSGGIPTTSVYRSDLHKNGMETIVAIFGQRAQKLLSPKIVQNVVSSVSKQMETLFAFASEYLSKGQNPPISSLK